MGTSRRWRAKSKRVRRPTEASARLAAVRKEARLTLRQVAQGVGVHPRTAARWESGDAHPSREQWSQTVAYLARFVPREAVALARAAGVASPIAEAPAVDAAAIEQALLRAADLLDVAPRRVRAAVREIVRATAAAHGSLVDLARAAEEREEGR